MEKIPTKKYNHLYQHYTSTFAQRIRLQGEKKKKLGFFLIWHCISNNRLQEITAPYPRMGRMWGRQRGKFAKGWSAVLKQQRRRNSFLLLLATSNSMFFITARSVLLSLLLPHNKMH